MRWHHPRLGRLGPDEFVGIAEESDTILLLGRAVLAQACAEAARWSQLTSSPLYVSVNVAASQLQDTDLVSDVSAVLEQTGLPASQLRLEITEGAIVRPDDRSVGTLHRLVDMGVALVIDDFGTGYSNFSYLRRLPANMIKIDRSFVADLYPPDSDADATSAEVLAAIISLAHVLGLSVDRRGRGERRPGAVAAGDGLRLGAGLVLRPAGRPGEDRGDHRRSRPGMTRSRCESVTPAAGGVPRCRRRWIRWGRRRRTRAL